VLGVDVAKDEFFAALMKTDRSVIDTIKCRPPDLAPWHYGNPRAAKPA
jgi:hypothetical protein